MTYRFLIIATLAAAASSPSQAGKRPDTTSKEPPAGAPWIKDFAKAHALARKSGRPIFVYSTKTY